jgi:L-asparaginase II
MAIGYARITNPEDLENRYKKAISQVVGAMIDNPFMIAGTNGFCTDLIANTNGKLIGKIGAEGIYCVGIKEKNIGIAVKIEDGNMNMLPPVVMHVLKTLRVLSAEELNNLEKYIIMDNLNDSGKKVGEIKPAFKLNIL